MREIKKERKTKYAFSFLSLYNQDGIVKKLTAMAEQGWLIENMENPFLWRYRRIEPRTLSFALVYSPHNFASNPESQTARILKDELCAADGWFPAASRETLCVYFNESTKPVPIETDPKTQVKTIFSAMRFRWCYYLLMLLLVEIFSLYMTANIGSGGLFAAFSSPHMLPLVLANLFLLFYVGYLLWSDIHWYRHAAKAADTAIFMSITHKRFSASWLALFIIAFVILLLTLSLCR